MPFFYNYGVNTIILRNRLRRDGYNPQTDEVYDAQQAIRMVRAYAERVEDRSAQDRHHGILGRARNWPLPAALDYDEFDETNA